MTHVAEWPKSNDAFAVPIPRGNDNIDENADIDVIKVEEDDTENQVSDENSLKNISSVLVEVA